MDVPPLRDDYIGNKSNINIWSNIISNSPR